MALSLATVSAGTALRIHQGIMALVAAILLVAVAMTGFRAGLVAAMIGAIGVLAFRQFERRRNRESRLRLGVFLTGLCAVSAAASWWVFSAQRRRR